MKSIFIYLKTGRQQERKYMSNSINDYEITGAIMRSKVPSKKYKDNYDAIFGSLTCNHCDFKQDNKNNVLCQSCGKTIDNKVEGRS